LMFWVKHLTMVTQEKLLVDADSLWEKHEDQSKNERSKSNGALASGALKRKYFDQWLIPNPYGLKSSTGA